MIQAAQSVAMRSGDQQQGAAKEHVTTKESTGRNLSTYDDDALMVRAQGGDKEAFEILVSRYMEMVLAISSRFLANPDAGRDVAQDVFLDLWLSRQRYTPGGKFKGYLSTLALNRCRDATRRRGAEQRRRTGLAAEGLSPQTDASDQAVKKQSAKMLETVLANLSDEDREILVMRYTMDLQYDEMAEATGRPAGTLRSRVFHALRKLRGMLEGES